MSFRVVIDSCGELTDEMKKSGNFVSAPLTLQVDEYIVQDDEEHFRQIPAEYFDLIIVDECHRGSAKEDSNWRKVLEYFSSATQIGMTATPKESEKVSNIDYFGEPVYTYSLKG